MTQEATNAGPAVATPAPSPAPASGAAPGGGSVEQSPYVQVQREQLAPWNHDYHAALVDAKRGKDLAEVHPLIEKFRQAGYTNADLQKIIDFYTQPDPAQTPPNVSAPLDARQLAGTLREQLIPEVQKTITAALEQERQRVATEQASTQRAQIIAQRGKAEQDFGVKTLTDLGFPIHDNEGKVNRIARGLYAEFQNTLNEVMAEGEPPNLTKEQREFYYSTPSDEVLKKAGEQMAWAKNVRYTMAAQVAREQEQILPSLGAGPGGKQPPPGDLEPGTPGFQRAVMEGVEL